MTIVYDTTDKRLKTCRGNPSLASYDTRLAKALNNVYAAIIVNYLAIKRENFIFENPAYDDKTDPSGDILVFPFDKEKAIIELGISKKEFDRAARLLDSLKLGMALEKLGALSFYHINNFMDDDNA